MDLKFPTIRSTVLTTSSQLAAQPRTVVGIEQPYATNLSNWHLLSQYCLWFLYRLNTEWCSLKVFSYNTLVLNSTPASHRELLVIDHFPLNLKTWLDCFSYFSIEHHCFIALQPMSVVVGLKTSSELHMNCDEAGKVSSLKQCHLEVKTSIRMHSIPRKSVIMEAIIT